MDAPARLLYEYTKALASGITISDEYLKTILPNLYLENKKPPVELPELVYKNDYPRRYSHAYSTALSNIGVSFGVYRSPGESDDLFRQRIKMALLKSPTSNGIKEAIEKVFSGINNKVTAKVIPSSKDFFDSVDSNFSNPFRGVTGSRVYKVSIEIAPEKKLSLPFFQDRLYAGKIYQIKKPGIYSLVFDPELLFSTRVQIRLLKTTIKSTQNKVTEEINSSLVFQGSTLNLGFLTNFNTLELICSTSLVLGNYYAGIVLSEYSFDFYKNPAYTVISTAFGVLLLNDIFSEILSSGVILEKITLKQTGTGG